MSAPALRGRSAGLRLTLAAGLVAAAAVPSRALAFVRETVNPDDPSTPCLFWNRRTVPFNLNPVGAPDAGPVSVFTALEDSFQTWSVLSCTDFKYELQGFDTNPDVGFNPALLQQPYLGPDLVPQDNVIFRPQLCAQVVPAGDDCLKAQNDDCDSRYSCWMYDEGAIALTTTSYDSTSGEIFNADIELNAVSFTFTTLDPPSPICAQAPAPQGPGCISTDLQNTVTHEVGHMLGLGHSTDSTATMYFEAPQGQTSKRTLAQDDINGICAIYPAGQPTVTCNEPEQPPRGCGCEGGAEQGWLAILASLFLFARPAPRTTSRPPRRR